MGDNRENRATYMKVWREKNKERRAATRRVWNENNKEKRALSRRAWGQKNKEKVAADNRVWIATHPEIARRHTHKRRAQKRNARIGDPKLISKWEKSWRSKKSVRCYWCSKRVSPKKCHADHVVALANRGEHSVENLCISCASCNLSKNSKPLESWNATLIQPVLIGA